MRLTRRRWVQCVIALCASTARARANPLVVFAAASLTDVLEALSVTPGFGGHIRFSFAASSTLARQIEQGAPADIFISADEAWMTYLDERRHVDSTSRRVVAGNRLVVVRQDATALAEVPESVAALRRALQPASAQAADRVATGDPAHVPVGRYAFEALSRLGLWDDVLARLVRADNVRSALAFVERGEAAAGIVYATDAQVTRGVQVAARFPLSSHTPIRYSAAVVHGTAAPAEAHLFLDALASPRALPVWRAAGFEPAP